MQPFAVEAFGRRINSPVPLPGIALSESQRDAELSENSIEIFHGAVYLESISRISGSYSIGSSGLKIAVSEALSFLCDKRGREIRVEATPNLTNAVVAEYLIANGIPAALWLQGERLLHSGAARLPGCSQGVLIAGDSGSGKSTVLAELVRRGAALVAEDACTLRISSMGVTAAGFPGYLQIRLNEESDNRVQIPVPPEQQQPFCPAGSIFVLNTVAGANDPTPRRLHGVEALQALLRNRYRPVVANLLDREADDLPMWVECSKLLSVYSWSPRTVQREEWTHMLFALCSSAEGRGGLA